MRTKKPVSSPEAAPVGRPIWTVARPCPGRIKMEGKWGPYWMLVTGDARWLDWEVGCGERRLAGRDKNDPALRDLGEAQMLAEAAALRLLAFDAYDPNARWRDLDLPAPPTLR
jgi:hypothetical protein